MSQDPELETQQLYLSFRVGEEHYGLPIARVREIIALPPVTRLPRTPAHVRGLVNIRGTVLPLLDLARYFGATPAPATRDTCVVVIESDLGGRERLFGLVADAVREVVELPSGTHVEAPEFGDRARVECLAGMVPTPSGLLLLLNPEHLFSPDQMLGFEQDAELARTLAAESAARPADGPDESRA
jgi:purine-binding chemotaxis protein CheW